MQNSKIVAVKNREFEITVPTPMAGCVILNFMYDYKLPYGLDERDMKPMPPDVLQQFQTECLKCVSEKLPSGKAPVIDKETGELGIIGATPYILKELTSQFVVFFMGASLEEKE